jgi:hypothetical protein
MQGNQMKRQLNFSKVSHTGNIFSGQSIEKEGMRHQLYRG